MSVRPAHISPEETDSSSNPKWFILFRIFFNSRFYYPVYALMFLDFGLTQEQFAALNLAWAIAIVVLEIPSGALADQVGRRPLVIAAAFLMMIEMVVMLFMPVVSRAKYEGNPEAFTTASALLFTVFLFNRVISGAAEAAASGADEALAYDSLPEEGRDQHWSKLTTKLMKWQSVAFIIVTLIGAAVYDPAFLNRFLAFCGSEKTLLQEQTLKIPIALTFMMSLGVLFSALRMKEPDSFQRPQKKHFLEATKDSFARTLKAGRWIAVTPAALMLLLTGLCFDSIIRLYYTVGSIWLETIGFEPAQFGLISVAGSLAGILAAVMGEKLIKTRSPGFNFKLLGLLTFVGIFSLAFPIRFWSVAFLPTLWISMRLLHFFLSNYLNRVTDAENRATVLSFRGLSMNLSYGILTWLYGMQTAYLSGRIEIPEGGISDQITHQIFTGATQSWWVYFAGVLLFLWLFRSLKIGKSWNELLK